EPPVVGAPGEEPQQLADDRLRVHALGGDERKAVGQVVAALPAEARERAHPRAVGSLLAPGQQGVEQLEVLTHQPHPTVTALGPARAVHRPGVPWRRCRPVRCARSRLRRPPPTTCAAPSCWPAHPTRRSGPCRASSTGGTSRPARPCSTWATRPTASTWWCG